MKLTTLQEKAMLNTIQTDLHWRNIVIDFFDNFLKEKENVDFEKELSKEEVKELVSQYSNSLNMPEDSKDILKRTLLRFMELEN